MKSAAGEVLYVGKARNIQKRVRSYFSGARDIKTRFLVRKVSTVESIITKNEYEALLLENNLIKELEPHYNINLKDGKTYPVIKLTSEEYPRLYRTRRIINDGSLYFGPYPHVKSIDRYLELIERLFTLRKCRGKLKRRDHPCLYYHIGRCSAPCCNRISRAEYAEEVERVKKLLSGESGEIIEELTGEMNRAVERLEFEKAAEARDNIQAIKTIELEQEVVDFNPESRDYVALASKEHLCSFTVFMMRNGKLSGRDLFRTEAYEEREEVLRHFLLQYYRKDHKPPARIFISEQADLSFIEEFFLKELKVTTTVAFPESRRDRSILKMAEENCIQDLEERLTYSQRFKALRDLKNTLGLPNLPRRIEGFDVAQLSGKYPVASMVSFINGEPDKKGYRHFHLKTLNGAIDDYEALREAVARRYTRVINEGLKKPDLILIDGGKGQVNAVKSILDALDVKITLVGLSKREELIVPVEGEPLKLKETHQGLKILQRVRDEAHRFANTFNRSTRRRELILSTLESVPGIGKKRSQKLLKTFGSLKAIITQDPEVIAKECGISVEKAGELLRILRDRN